MLCLVLTLMLALTNKVRYLVSNGRPQKMPNTMAPPQYWGDNIQLRK